MRLAKHAQGLAQITRIKHVILSRSPVRSKSTGLIQIKSWQLYGIKEPVHQAPKTIGATVSITISITKVLPGKVGENGDLWENLQKSPENMGEMGLMVILEKKFTTESQPAFGPTFS